MVDTIKLLNELFCSPTSKLECLKYYEVTDGVRKLQAVAQAADELMATLGADGEIDTLHPKTQILLDALYAWRPRFQELNLVENAAITN